jgi:hypothetical protein
MLVVEWSFWKLNAASSVSECSAERESCCDRLKMTALDRFRNPVWFCGL